MKKLLISTFAITSLMTVSANAASCLATDANGKSFHSASTYYSSNAVVNRPASLTTSNDYMIGGDLFVNNNLKYMQSGDLQIGGNMIVTDTLSHMGSGDLNIGGDVLVTGTVNLRGSGDTRVGGTVYVVDGYGRINNQGSGDVYADVRYISSISEIACNSAAVHTEPAMKKVDIQVKEYGKNYIVDLDSDILFNFDSADITPASARSLNQVADLIRNDRKGLVIFRGHTDSVGQDSYNISLSENRANSVAAYLLTNEGLDVDYMRVQGYGESYPKADNSSELGRAQNRRVEIIIQREAGIAIPEVTEYISIVGGDVGTIVGHSLGSAAYGVGSAASAIRGEDSVHINGGGVKVRKHNGAFVDTNSNGSVVMQGSQGGSVTTDNNGNVIMRGSSGSSITTDKNGNVIMKGSSGRSLGIFGL